MKIEVSLNNRGDALSSSSSCLHKTLRNKNETDNSRASELVFPCEKKEKKANDTWLQELNSTLCKKDCFFFLLSGETLIKFRAERARHLCNEFKFTSWV